MLIDWRQLLLASVILAGGPADDCCDGPNSVRTSPESAAQPEASKITSSPLALRSVLPPNAAAPSRPRTWRQCEGRRVRDAVRPLAQSVDPPFLESRHAIAESRCLPYSTQS